MKFYICYDITEDKIRDKIVAYLETFANRIQYSVFYCNLDEDEAPKVKKELMKITCNADNPLLLMIPVCKSCDKKTWMKGIPLESGDSFIIA